MLNVQSKVELSGKDVKELKKVIKGVSHNKMIPILNNVKITLAENEIIAFVTNLDFTVTKRIPAETKGHGSFLLPISEVKSLKGFKNQDTITIEFDGQKAKMNNTSFNTGDPEAYPKNNLDEYELINTVTYDEILNIEKAILSTSKSQSRPALTGVLFRKGEIISTDSHRLFKTASQIEHDQDILIPAEAVKNLKDHFTKDSKVQVSIRNHDLKFEDEQTTFEVRLLEGSYPDVSRIIPDSLNSSTSFKITNIKEFTNVITSAASITKSTPNNVIQFSIENNSLQVTANDIDKSFEAEYTVNKFTGDSLKIAMSGKYLLEALKQVEGNEITFYFHGHLRPFTVEGSGKELALILPVRTVN